MYIKRTKSIFNLKPKGFTLIELLVVISIIGVLGSTIYAPFNEARKKGRDAKRVAELGAIQSALILFSDDHSGCFPIAKKYTAATYYNNMLHADNYKYVSKGLYDKVNDNPSSIPIIVTPGVTSGGVVMPPIITFQNIPSNSPYQYISFSKGNCISEPANSTDYSNMYFQYYQLYVNLETHSSSLDGDRDLDRTPVYSNGDTIPIIFSSTSFERCSNPSLPNLDCIYDLSNY